jgi:hypothetical protein
MIVNGQGGVVGEPIDDVNATINSLANTTAICIGDKLTWRMMAREGSDVIYISIAVRGSISGRP